MYQDTPWHYDDNSYSGKNIYFDIGSIYYINKTFDLSIGFRVWDSISIDKTTKRTNDVGYSDTISNTLDYSAVAINISLNYWF
ncbi:MAG: hypothetical protein U9Q20_01295 [Campylobacterota bacterium]|nr:hypothetical protein [Campylobacterota bacterium]